jgi:hypothetical protein
VQADRQSAVIVDAAGSAQHPVVVFLQTAPIGW